MAKTRKRMSRRRMTLRRNKNKNKSNRKMRIGGSGKKVAVKSLPDDNKSKLENEINKYDYSIIKFYMNGCPHCEDIKEMWEDVGKDHKEELQTFCRENNCNLGVFQVEVREYSDPIDEKYIGKDQGVPHIICVNKKIGEINIFDDERNVENVNKFVKKNIKGNKK
jgi:hypothetical protein